MNELDVFRLLLARRNNYDISEIEHTSGRSYSIIMAGRHYNAVVLPNSFSFYEKRYHICRIIPDLVICFVHDTALPIPVLSLKAGKIALPYDLPSGITDVEQQRHRSKVGSQVLLGMYLCGMKEGQMIVNGLKPTTRKRYIERARLLGKRKRGRPVDTQQAQSKAG